MIKGPFQFPLGARHAGLFPWLSRFVITGGAQGAVQLLGFLGGVLVIRLLPAHEFAYYTIALSALGMMTVLSDAGVSSGFMAQGGGCWQDRTRLGVVFNEAMRLRRQLALGALGLALPLVVVLLHRQGADLPVAVMIAAALLPVYFATLTGQLRENAFKLHQDLGVLQGAQIGGALTRVLLLVVSLFALPFTVVALVAAGLAQAALNLVLRRRSSRLLDAYAGEDPEVRAKLRAYVARTLPGAVFYAFAGQLTVGLISIFGSTGDVAQVGVAGRLAMICNVLAAVSNVLLVPRFARLPNEPARLRRIYFGLLTGLSLTGAVILGAIHFLPEAVDWVLGPQYHGLHYEVKLGFLGALMGLVGGVAYTLAAVRNVVASPWVSVPLAALWQAGCVATAELDTAAGVLIMGCKIAAFSIIFHAFLYLRSTKGA